MASTGVRACPLRAQVDPRLLRFSAGATASVLAVVLLIVGVARPLGLGLLASQVAVFAFTAFVSFQWSLWAQIFARFIWPRIGAPTALEDARPHRFGQLVGFVLTALALIGFALGDDLAGLGLTALTFGVTALNALTGICLGCKAYPLIRRGR
jgi:fumarate reductase subunit D